MTDEDFASVKPPPKKARTSVKDPDSERNCKTTSVSPNEVVDLTSSGNRKRLHINWLFTLWHIIVSTHRPAVMGHWVYMYSKRNTDSWLLCYFRTSLDDKLYERDLETALTLSLLDSPRTQDGEPTTITGKCTSSIIKLYSVHSGAALYFTAI